MSQLAWIDVATVLHDNSGWGGEDLSIGIAITQPESERDPSRVSPPNEDGSVDRGLMQVNSSHLHAGGLLDGWSPQQLLDPKMNVRAAFIVWKAQGWKAWSTYNKRLHEPYLPIARCAMDGRARLAACYADRARVQGLLDAARASLADEVDTVERLQGKIDAAKAALS